MAKSKVNAISKGRAAKGKRETIPRTRTTSTGAQQFDRGPETIPKGVEFGTAWAASMDKKYPGRGLDEMEADMAKIDKDYRQGLSDIGEAFHKRKMARKMSGVKGYAMGGKVRGGGAATKGLQFRKNG